MLAGLAQCGPSEGESRRSSAYANTHPGIASHVCGWCRPLHRTGSRESAVERGHAEDHRARQHVHRARRVEHLGTRTGDDPRGARGRLAHRARRCRARRTPTRRSPPAGRRTSQPKWPLKVATDVPDKDGWSKQRNYSYQTSPNERRDVVAGVQFANGRLDRRDLRHGAGGRREARRAGRADLRQAAAEGLLARDVRRQEGAPPRRRAHRRAHQVHRGRRRRRPACPASRSVSCRTARSCSPAASACASSAAPAKVDGDTLYMIASNTKALTTLLLAKLVDAGKITWKTPVTQLLPQFKLGNADTTQPRARRASDLRLHRLAAAGHGVAVPVQGRHAGRRARDARDRAADQQVRRDVPVLEPAGRRRRLRRRARAVSAARDRRRLRQGDADAKCSIRSA